MSRKRDCRNLFSRILVTGATGFLGRALIPRLIEERYSITALGKSLKESPFPSEVEYKCGDLTDHDFTRALQSRWKWDAVVNLAGSIPKIGAANSEIIRQHVLTTLNLCSAISEGWPGRLIHASSMVVYGTPVRIPVNENSPRCPIDAYGMAKCIAEDILFAFGGESLKDCWILRFPGLFSLERKSGALFHFISASLQGRPIEINPPRPTAWDVLDVRDAAESVLRILRAKESNAGALNLSYGTKVSLLEIAEKIARRGRAEILDKSGFDHPVFHMDIEKARKLINWPPVDLEVRLDQLWDEISSCLLDLEKNP
jgi:nucleoside-diphosphate-sugar epimerase